MDERRAVAAGTAAWLALAGLLGLAAVLGRFTESGRIDWEPALALREPWRAWSAVAVHYSASHLAANLAGLLLIGTLGSAARLPPRSALAWCVAWPLTQFALRLRPDLEHAGGLSGVLHAAVAVVGVHLLVARCGIARLVGGAVFAGLVIKVVGEAPWGPPLRHPPGWDIAVAPAMHAAGAVAGTLCAAVVETVRRCAAPAPDRRRESPGG